MPNRSNLEIETENEQTVTITNANYKKQRDTIVKDLKLSTNYIFKYSCTFKHNN